MNMGEGRMRTGSGGRWKNTVKNTQKNYNIWGKCYIDFEECCDRSSSIDINIMYVQWGY